MIADQGMWTLTNFALVVLVARLSSVDSFGLFGIAFGSVLVAGGLVSTLAGEVLGVTRGAALRHSGVGSLPQTATRATEHAFGVVIIAGILAPLATAVVVWFYRNPGAASSIAWALVAVAPLAVMAEGTRSLMYALRRTDITLQVSATRLGVFVIALTVIGAASSLDAIAVVIAWGLSALPVMVLALMRIPIRPRFLHATQAERLRRRQFGFEYVATSGPSQGMVFLAGAILGLPAAGAIRALQSLYGPLNVVSMGLRRYLIPVVAEDPSNVRRLGVTISLSAAGVAALGTTALLAFPSFGEWLLGDNWPADRWVVAGFGLWRCAVSAVLGALIILRAYDQGSWSSRLGSISALALLIPFTLGMQIDLKTALLMSGVTSLAGAVLWWWFAFHLKDRHQAHGER